MTQIRTMTMMEKDRYKAFNTYRQKPEHITSATKSSSFLLSDDITYCYVLLLCCYIFLWHHRYRMFLYLLYISVLLTEEVNSVVNRSHDLLTESHDQVTWYHIDIDVSSISSLNGQKNVWYATKWLILTTSDIFLSVLHLVKTSASFRLFYFFSISTRSDIVDVSDFVSSSDIGALGILLMIR